MKARLLVGSPHDPSSPSQGCLSSWPSDIRLRQCQAQDRPLWESADQSQALVILRAQAGTGHFLCPTMTTRSPQLCHFSATLTEKGIISHNRNSDISVNSLSCQSLPGPLSFYPGYFIVEPGNTQHSLHLPSIYQYQGALDAKYGSSISPSSGARSGFPRSSCHLCWAKFT